MLKRIENFMDKLLPKIAYESEKRQKRTDEVVQKSHEARKSSEDNLFAAYREAGIMTARMGHPRKWD